MRRTFALALFTAASLASAGTALAQDAATPRAFTFGVSGGLSLPMGDFGDVVKSGFNGGALVEFKPAMIPFGLRVEGQFNRFDYDESAIASDANLRIISGAVNALFGVPAASSSFRPYVIGGVGLYNSKASFESDVGSASASGTDFGVNAGAGIEFGLSGLATFIEARFNSVFTEGSNTNYIPVSFGIKF